MPIAPRIAAPNSLELLFFAPLTAPLRPFDTASFMPRPMFFDMFRNDAELRFGPASVLLCALPPMSDSESSLSSPAEALEALPPLPPPLAALPPPPPPFSSLLAAD